jgi:hypothetical protein
VKRESSLVPPSPLAEKVDGNEGLKRLAGLTRAVIAVPKRGVVDPPEQKKRHR